MGATGATHRDGRGKWSGLSGSTRRKSPRSGRRRHRPRNHRRYLHRPRRCFLESRWPPTDMPVRTRRIPSTSLRLLLLPLEKTPLQGIQTRTTRLRRPFLIRVNAPACFIHSARDCPPSLHHDPLGYPVLGSASPDAPLVRHQCASAFKGILHGGPAQGHRDS